MATAALVLGIVGLFFNPLAIPSILALTFSFEADQYTKEDYGKCIAARTLAILEIVYFVLYALGLILRG